MRTTGILAIVAALSLCIPAWGAESTDAKLSRFQELQRKVQTDPGAASERSVRELLALGKELGLPYTASLAVKGYLAHHARPSSALLLGAAENALWAGDYRAAAARYKAYLRSAGPGRQASEIAARLYTILIDFMADRDDAYQFMSQFGTKFRQSPAARRFDGWYIREARRRKDYAAAARFLAAVLAEKMPLEKERLYFWHHLDWLLTDIARAAPEHYPALSHCRKLVKLIRGSKRRTLRYGFHVANLAFHAASAGKDREALEADFAQVVAAARSYFDAFPSAETLKDIIHTFAGGPGTFSDAAWGRQTAQKQKFFVYAFEKLSDADRAAMISWRTAGRGYVARFLASRAQWTELGIRHAALFARTPAVRYLPFVVLSDDPKLFAAQARFLRGVPSYDAAVINSVAAGGDDLGRCADHLVGRELWHLRYGEVFRAFERGIWPAFKKLHGKDKEKTSPAYYAKALIRLGSALARTPVVLFDPEGAGRYLRALWDYSDDKGRVIKHLEALQWVPWTARQRKVALNSAQGAFRGWAVQVTKAAKRKGSKVSPETLKQISPIAAAFKRLSRADVAKAPNALCRNMALAVMAARKDGRASAAFGNPAREVYKLVADYDVRKVPCGRASLDYVLHVEYRRGPRNLGFLCEVLADQLARYDPRRDNSRIEAVLEAVMSHPYDPHIRARRQADMKKVNAVFAKALLRQLERGQFWPVLFDWFRATRAGSGWKALDWGQEVMGKIIQRRVFHKTAYRPVPGIRSATASYMWLIRQEFPKLNRKYPVGTYFDDMFVQEAAKTNYLDWHYWDFGQDAKKKVVNAAARVLQGYQVLPFGHNGPQPVYARTDFWNWQERALGAEKPIRDAMMAKVESYFGRTRFDTYAMGRPYFATQADAARPKGRKAFFEALARYLQRVSAANDRLPLPYLGQLRHVREGKALSDEELAVLLSIFPDRTPTAYPRGGYCERLVELIADALLQRGREVELYPLIPHFWKVARDVREPAFMQALARLGKTLLGRNRHDLAYVFATCGLERHPGLLAGDARAVLLAVRSKALSQIGGVIPVKKSDPRYPIFAAQASYLTGRLQRARELYAAHRQRVPKMYKDLDPRFCIWLIEQDTALGQYAQAETLARLLTQWFESLQADFEPELRAQLQLSFADIFFARQEYPIATARYKSIVAAEEFKTTAARKAAELKLAEVYRLTRRYDQAIAELERIAQRSDKAIQAQAYYQMALVRFDQEQYREARELLEKVFLIAPDHSEARILEGKVFLKLKRVELATEIEAGTPTRKNFLVPGTPLVVSLTDQNLSIVGGARSIELRAWTDSGDEEFFYLSPFDESKTKFKGKLPTALGRAVKGDGVLQVLGQEKVHFDFSEAVKRANRITVTSVNTLTVVTDAELLASSGAILTPQQREQLELERLIRRRLARQLGPEKPDVALATVRQADQVKPGNPVNVRLIDPDRSTTNGRDTVTVRVATTSGDGIRALVLRETGTHTGVFEGAIPTASGCATAYASDTADGKDANFAISSKDYGPWVAQADNVRPKTFSIDLNDNVAPAEMAIHAGVTLRKLTNFLVQTSLNGRDFVTVAAWPKKFQPWDGSQQLEVVPALGEKVPRTLEELRRYLQTGYITVKAAKTALSPPAVPRLRLSYDQARKAKVPYQGHYVIHLKAAFYQPVRRTRTFELIPRDGLEPRRRTARYFLAIDGQPARPVRGRAGPQGVQRLTLSLGKGVHRVDLYAVARHPGKMAADLMWDIDKAPYIAAPPAEAFDVKKHPEIRKGIYRAPGQITANADGTRFKVSFPPQTRARVIRLVLVDFETDAPAINKITLTDRRGRTVLPVKEDFMALRRNGTLEIVPGDKITITYEDPAVLTAGQEVQETALRATYGNATISACFVEYTMTGSGERRARYVPMRRFGPADKIQVFISDPDMDVSDKLDTVRFTARSSEGGQIELTALETEKHSGVFIGAVFPVAGRPQRKSELTVRPGDDVILTYLDKENTDPGIPWRRSCVIEQVYFKKPQLWVYNVTSEPLEQAPKAPAGKAPQALADEDIEIVPPSRRLVVTRPPQPEPAGPVAAIIGAPLVMELIFPTIAKSPESTAVIYVQTSSGRKAFGKPLGPDEFDINVPGTIKVEARPGDLGRIDPPPGYLDVIIQNKRAELLRGGDSFSALDDGRFSFTVPMELAKLPDRSLATGELEEEPGRRERPKLAIKGDDEVFIGFKYTDSGGQARWIVRRVRLDADAFFHVADRRYRKTITALYVGQKAYFRVIDPRRDTSDHPDRLEIELSSASGATRRLKLTETFSHSGVFKGLVKFTYAGVKAAGEPDAMPVKYGDVVTAAYTPTGKGKPIGRRLEIFKGSDGLVLPFTKRFKDTQMAMRTQFMIAEAYLELAKRHRELGEDSAARREIAQGKKLLEEALRDFPQTEARAQTEYLLAELALEFANDARNPKLKRKFQDEAINRFTNIVATYPDSEYAPKAQYKKALTLEKMGKFDEACEEYVKLSYRYPDNELVAETIARLGQYFMLKGKAFREQAKKEPDEVKREAINVKSRKMFKTAGEVLARLGQRFPQHHLAAKTAVLSAQCYMYAEEFVSAIRTFEKVINTPNQDPALIAESMYWCGDSYLKLPDDQRRRLDRTGQLDPARKAYQLFKRLDWDYPTTKWARYARGRLATDDRFEEMD